MRMVCHCVVGWREETDLKIMRHECSITATPCPTINCLAKSSQSHSSVSMSPTPVFKRPVTLPLATMNSNTVAKWSDCTFPMPLSPGNRKHGWKASKASQRAFDQGRKRRYVKRCTAFVSGLDSSSTRCFHVCFQKR